MSPYMALYVAPYTKQYTNELEADRYMLAAAIGDIGFNWSFYIYGILAISVLFNALFLYRIWKQKQSKTKDLKAKLSKQEQVVLAHILQNKTNKDIAESLFLSVRTVKSHTNNSYKKLNVQSRDDAKSLFIK